MIVARSLLERFRKEAVAADLEAARTELQQIRPAGLSPSDQAELIIALGELLYLDDQPGAAAEEFERALDRVDPMTQRRASACSTGGRAPSIGRRRCARSTERAPLYLRIVAGWRTSCAATRRSAVASYWLVAGARGSGDLERAWDAAFAAWARASLTGDRRAQLRADLDQIVTQAIIPERARLMAPAGGAAQSMAAMRVEWDALKQAGGRKVNVASRLQADVRRPAEAGRYGRHALAFEQLRRERRGLVRELFGKHEVLRLQRLVGLLAEPLRDVVLRLRVDAERAIVDPAEIARGVGEQPANALLRLRRRSPSSAACVAVRPASAKPPEARALAAALAGSARSARDAARPRAARSASCAGWASTGGTAVTIGSLSIGRHDPRRRQRRLEAGRPAGRWRAPSRSPPAVQRDERHERSEGDHAAEAVTLLL